MYHCQGCTERREWIKKWIKVGADRTKALLGGNQVDQMTMRPIIVDTDNLTSVSHGVINIIPIVGQVITNEQIISNSEEEEDGAVKQSGAAETKD